MCSPQKVMGSPVTFLSQLLSEAVNTGNTENIHLIMNYMLRLMSQDVDLTSLAGNVMKLLPLPHLLLKKVLCSYLIKHSRSISDLASLACNSLLKDFSDPNPLVRSLALRTVFRIPHLNDLAFDLLPKALADSSSNVRRTAVTFCPKIITPLNIESHTSIVNQLYSMIRDKDPQVMVSCLLSLETILQHEGGVVVKYKMIQYIISRMSMLSEWSLVFVCNILNKYTPKNDEEVIYFLNILDDQIQDKNPIIAIHVLQILLHFVKGHNVTLEKTLMEHLSQRLLSVVLSNCSYEVLLAVLELIENLLIMNSKELPIPKAHYKYFLCHFQDPDYVKVKKLRILPLMLDPENSNEIMKEMLLYATRSKFISKQAIQGIVHILNMSQVSNFHHVQTLSKLLCLDRNYLIDETVQSLTHLSMNNIEDSCRQELLMAISNQFQKIRTNEGKTALLILISKNSNDMESSTYILEHIFNQETYVNNDIFCSVLLRSAVKLFLLRPSEMQFLLGQIFQKYMSSSSSLVKKQVLFYYNLLHIDPVAANNILNKDL